MNIFNIMNPDFWISLLYRVPAIVIGLSFHEFAHAYAAYRMGDNTAKSMGRMTLNPLAHFDPVGILCMILLGFGWAKPVPVNNYNYKGNKRRADIIVSLAGVTMNFIIAFFAMFLYYFLLLVCGVTNEAVLLIVSNIVMTNLVLMVFNLIPVPPLDGSHVLEDLLAPKLGIEPFMFLRRYSMPILLVVLLLLNTTGALSRVVLFLTGLLEKLFFLIFRAYI